MMDDPTAPLDTTFSMIANAACLCGFVPRMDIQRYLPALHDRTYKFFLEQAKNLNLQRIDMGYFCIDVTGRRLYSLTEVYQSQNELRRNLICEFLDMNLEKKMLALRYLNDLIHPKKPYSIEEREQVDIFMK